MTNTFITRKQRDQMARNHHRPQPTQEERPTMDNDRNGSILLAAAAIAMGLLAGLFYGFDVAVMPSLAAADDRTLIDAMQVMIDKIENPGFYLTMAGAPTLATIALVQAHRSGSAKATRWIIAGLGFYMVMMVVTVAVHFPLNDELKAAGDPALIKDPAAVRDDFLTPWVVWNIVRTLSSTAAFACLTWALVLRGRTGR